MLHRVQIHLTLRTIRCNKIIWNQQVNLKWCNRTQILSSTIQIIAAVSLLIPSLDLANQTSLWTYLVQVSLDKRQQPISQETIQFPTKEFKELNYRNSPSSTYRVSQVLVPHTVKCLASEWVKEWTKAHLCDPPNLFTSWRSIERVRYLLLLKRYNVTVIVKLMIMLTIYG